MDRMYLKTILDQLEREKVNHPHKFGDNPVHAKCLPNFNQAIDKLRKELEKLGEDASGSSA